MIQGDQKICLVAACAIVIAGGVAFLAGFGTPESAPPALATAKLHAKIREARPGGLSSGQFTADQLLANKPPPGQGYSIEADAAMLGVIRQLLAQSPRVALIWAQSTTFPAWRDLLQTLVVRQWAESDPSAALRWALTSEGPNRADAVNAALLGLARQPKLAADLGRELLEQDPTNADEFGPVLTGALIRNGQFSVAVQFADIAPEGLRVELTTLAFSRWAEQQPQTAAQALSLIKDQTSYAQAYAAVIAAWAGVQPATLTEYTLSLPSGEDRTEMLATAMNQWAAQDPVGLAAWLINLPPSPERDVGAAAFLAHTDRADRDTQSALNWAESITDPNQRFAGIASVLPEWARNNPTAAQNYAENTSLLSQDQRASLLNMFNGR